MHTKDSALGPDGISYSAWRLLPDVIVDALLSYFYDIVNDTALPLLQVGVWIPKAKSGPTVDHFRPLGMPNTIDRLIDGAIASHVMSYTAYWLHFSQAVMSCFKEPQKAVTAIQTILDSSDPACALLADLSEPLSSPPCPKTTDNREIRAKVTRALVVVINGGSCISINQVNLVRRTAFSEVIMIVSREDAGKT